MARREGIPKPCPPPLGLCTRLLDSSPMLYWFPVTNHRPQTSGLKTTDIELLTVPEATSLKLRCQQGHTPSGGSWGRGGGAPRGAPSWTNFWCQCSLACAFPRPLPARLRLLLGIPHLDVCHGIQDPPAQTTRDDVNSSQNPQRHHLRKDPICR